MKEQADIAFLERMATQVRRDVIRMVHAAQSGHPGGGLGCADSMVALYFYLMEHHPPFTMVGRDEDVFFLSNGHISPVWYSVLARSGYFPLHELRTFRRIDSRLQGHPATEKSLPGVRVASGSLGQGLSVAIGMAQAKKLSGDAKRVYVLMGDGEQQEGQIWEAAMYAAHCKVDNLIALVDCNGQQIDGPVAKVLDIGSLRAKYEAFGWRVLSGDGNSMVLFINKMEEAKRHTGHGKPVIFLMSTVMGCGVDFMANDHTWHGVAPNDQQAEAALRQLPETIGDF